MNEFIKLAAALLKVADPWEGEYPGDLRTELVAEDGAAFARGYKGRPEKVGLEALGPYAHGSTSGFWDSKIPGRSLSAGKTRQAAEQGRSYPGGERVTSFEAIGPEGLSVRELVLAGLLPPQ